MPWKAALGVLLLGWVPSAAAAEAALTDSNPCRAVLVVDVEDGSDETHLTTKLVTEALDGAVKSEPRSVTLQGPGAERVSWPAGEALRVQAQAEGYWSSPEVLPCSLDPEPQRVRLHLYPASALEGRVQVPKGSSRPKNLEVHFRPTAFTPSSAKLPDGRVDCAVAEDGRFSCEVPQGTLDLRLRHPGFAVVYRWGVEVDEQPTSLARIELVPGASMAGFVVVESTTVSPDVWVELRPEAAGRASPAVRQRLDAMELRTAPDERGFFQLRDVPPGTYRLRAGADSFVPVSLSPIRIVEGKESFLRAPLRLAPPVPFHLVVDPPVAPDGAPWTISLHPVPDAAGVSEGGFRGPADNAGNWSRAHLAPGDYNLTVESARGRWFRDTVTITELSPFHEIVLDALEVEGVVRSGETPVEAVVWLGDRHAEERMRFETDSAGRFDATLPRPGKWPVALTLGSSQYVSLEAIHVEVPEHGGAARIEIEIPDTKLLGEVVDGRGQAVGGARVEVFSRDARRDQTKVESSENGEFEVLGVPPGSYSVSAVLPDPSSPVGRSAASDAVTIEIDEGRPTEDIRLVVQRFKTVRGRVVSPSGPVQGAMVVARPETAALLTPAVLEDVVTGPTGTFQVTVPENAIALSLVVVPPGFATRLLRVPLQETGEVEIPVNEVGGTVYLGVEGWDHTKPPHLHADGTWAPLFMFQPRQIVTADGSAWILPKMAPGTYVLCSGVFVDETCSRGTLPPGGELILEKSEASSSGG